jgi:dTDP-4-amino-4,6-dideoxygalactose transaminase
MPVHLYGQAADMDPLGDLAREHGLAIVEDAAQAAGTEYPGRDGVRRAGAMGRMGCFSFFPSKNLGGFGDGGMVTVDSADAAERLRSLRNHGSAPKYYHRAVGGNFRLDALQAVVLDVKLGHLETWHAGRRRNAARYDEAFAGSPVRSPAAVYAGSGAGNYHIYNQYVVRVPDRDAVWQRLKDAGVGCEVYYPVPLHLQECFRDLGYGRGDFPESEAAAEQTLALPIYPELGDDMQDHVIRTLLDAVA